MNQPLLGCTFCCTAVPVTRRQEINDKIMEMGGVHHLDLMSDVKYLIVGSTNTDKYLFLVNNRRDIIFLRDDAIDLVYDSWKLGQSFDLNQYLLPIFHKMLICLSRINDRSSKYEPSNYEPTIHGNGGQISQSLTSHCTCLITDVTSGKRYSKALEWGIPVVHPAFILKCHHRKARLPFDDYLLHNYDPNKDDAVMLKNDNPSLKESRNPLPHLATAAPPPPPTTKPKPSIWNSIMNPTPKDPLPSPKKPASPKTYIFTNIKFKLQGFNKEQSEILMNIIKTNNGEVIDGNGDYLLIPFNSLPPTNLDSYGPIKTEWLIERSIYYNKLVDDDWSNPIAPISLPNGFKHKYSISLSGFKGIELLHLTKLIELIGFNIQENFNSKTNLLIININIFKSKLSPSLFTKRKDLLNCPYNSINSISTKNKINASKSWKIPILSINFLFEILSLSDYSLKLPDVKNLDWCLFYSSNENNQFLVRQQQSGDFTSSDHDSIGRHHESIPNDLDNGEDSNSTDTPTLPSPKKFSGKKRFGKLLTNNTKFNANGDINSNGDEESNNEENLSFDIGYEGSIKRRRGI